MEVVDFKRRKTGYGGGAVYNDDLIITASTIPDICPPLDSKRIAVAVDKYHYLKGLNIVWNISPLVVIAL